MAIPRVPKDALVPEATARDRLFQAIIEAEGTAKQGNPYNEVVGYGRWGRPSKELTDMTLAELEAFGRELARTQRAKDPDFVKRNGGTSSAVGAFQILASSTMKDVARALGLDPQTTKFTPEVQRQMAEFLATNYGVDSQWAGFSKNPAARKAAKVALREVKLTPPGDIPAGTLDAESVKSWQSYLNETLDANLQVDGVYGPRTRAATKSFQETVGVANPTGVMDEETAREAIRIANQQTDPQFKQVLQGQTQALASTYGVGFEPGREAMLERRRMPEALSFASLEGMETDPFFSLAEALPGSQPSYQVPRNRSRLPEPVRALVEEGRAAAPPAPMAGPKPAGPNMVSGVDRARLREELREFQRGGRPATPPSYGPGDLGTALGLPQERSPTPPPRASTAPSESFVRPYERNVDLGSALGTRSVPRAPARPVTPTPTTAYGGAAHAGA